MGRTLLTPWDRPVPTNPTIGRQSSPDRRPVNPRKQSMIDLHYWTTPNGHKITMFLEETGLPYRIVPVNLVKDEQFAPDFLAIAPNNKMPAIVDRDPSGGGVRVRRHPPLPCREDRQADAQGYPRSHGRDAVAVLAGRRPRPDAGTAHATPSGTSSASSDTRRRPSGCSASSTNASRVASGSPATPIRSRTSQPTVGGALQPLWSRPRRVSERRALA